MARKPRSSASIPTTDYRHLDKRPNNPTSANIGEGSAPLSPPLEYSPHRPPQLRWNADSNPKEGSPPPP